MEETITKMVDQKHRLHPIYIYLVKMEEKKRNKENIKMYEEKGRIWEMKGLHELYNSKDNTETELGRSPVLGSINDNKD